MLRLGLLPFGVMLFVEGVLRCARYFNSTVLMLGGIVALATWAFFAATAGQRLWKQEWFD